MVIVGNKCDRDLHRAVTTGELQDLVDAMPNCVGMEASALLNHNVEEVVTGSVSYTFARGNNSTDRG